MQTSHQGNPFSSGHQIIHIAAIIKHKEPNVEKLCSDNRKRDKRGETIDSKAGKSNDGIPF